MLHSRLPLLISVFISFTMIWLLNEMVIVGECSAQGGVFEYEYGKCVLANGEIYTSDIAYPMMVLYTFIGFSVSFFGARLIRKLPYFSQ